MSIKFYKYGFSFSSGKVSGDVQVQVHLYAWLIGFGFVRTKSTANPSKPWSHYIIEIGAGPVIGSIDFYIDG